MKREAPPNADTRTTGKQAYTAEAAEARKNPGVWFVFREWGKDHTKKDDATARSISSNIKHGRFAAFVPAGVFDAVSRRLEDGSLKVYLMYLGKAVEDEIKEKAAK
jgi:hypothetical protein